MNYPKLSPMVFHLVLFEAATKHKNYQELSLPSITAENIANSVAFSSIEYILNNGLDYDLTKIAQSVSFGSAQGAQLASVYEKSLNYTNSWEKFSRKDIISHHQVVLMEP